MDAEAVTTNVDTELKRKLLEYAEVLEQSMKSGEEGTMSQYEASRYLMDAYVQSACFIAAGVLLALFVLFALTYLWSDFSIKEPGVLILLFAIFALISPLGLSLIYYGFTTGYKAVFSPNAYVMQIIEQRQEKEQLKNVPWQPKGERE